jgi:hypothetical protein
LKVAPLAWATMIALLWLIMMERAVHALFVVSLAALGLSPTLLAIPLLFSAFIYPLGLAKRWPHSERFLTTTTVVALAAILLTIVAPSSWAVICAALSILALTVLLFDATALLADTMVLPCVLAVLLSMTLHTLNGTAAPGLTERGVLLLVALVLAAALARWATHRQRADRKALPATITGAWAVLAFLLLEYQLLAAPSQLSTLHANLLDGPTPHAWWYFAMLVSSQLGLLTGLRRPLIHNTGRPALVATVVVHFVCIALLITGVAYVIAPVWVILAQATAVYLLTIALSGTARTPASAGTLAGAVQVAWWLLVVLHAFSTKWPFLPAFVWPLLVGKATIYLLLSFLLLPLGVLAAVERKRL